MLRDAKGPAEAAVHGSYGVPSLLALHRRGKTVLNGSGRPASSTCRISSVDVDVGGSRPVEYDVDAALWPVALPSVEHPTIDRAAVVKTAPKTNRFRLAINIR